MNNIAKIYAIRPIRISFKLAVCILGAKVLGDFLYWATAGAIYTFPRYTMQHQAAQHLISPPVLEPYPLEQQPKHRESLRLFNQYNQKIYELLASRPHLTQKIYKNVPERENPNQIDHFMQYCEASRILESIYTKVLKKMSNNGAAIPEGISQKIRQLSQYQLQKAPDLITPQL